MDVGVGGAGFASQARGAFVGFGAGDFAVVALNAQGFIDQQHVGGAEDRAVDLYVLERAVTAAHAGAAGDAIFAAVLAAYKSSSRAWCSTLNKFAEVRLRGRKRSMVG